MCIGGAPAVHCRNVCLEEIKKNECATKRINGIQSISINRDSNRFRNIKMAHPHSEYNRKWNDLITLSSADFIEVFDVAFEK